MPILLPPPDKDIPLEPEEISDRDYTRIEKFLKMLGKGWKCGDCGLTNFNGNTHCANWKCRRLK